VLPPEDRELVRLVLQLLPERHRGILCLRYLEEMPVEEVARLLGVPPRSAARRQRRAERAFAMLYKAVG